MSTRRHTPHELRKGLSTWKELVRPYQSPNQRQAAWQVVNTTVPLLAMWTLTYLSLRWSIWLAAPLAIPTAFLVSRLFILQHDCGHYSFVRGRRANERLGFAFSLFTSIPFHYWAKVHRFHHKHNGQFEGRGVGDVPFLRVSEYRRLPRWLRGAYRVVRTPIFMFGIAPAIYLFICQRLPLTPLSNPSKTIRKQLFNNACIALLYIGLASILGWKEFFIVQGMVLTGFGTIAFWVFHVQHLHEHTLKEESADWSHLASAMQGSSHYDLPDILHWLTGNIGYHHIHHLSPAIPNYKLSRCYRDEPVLTRYAASITVRESWSQVNSDLWDDDEQKMVSFAELARKEAKDSTYVYEPTAAPSLN